jgi:peptide/nickel transport system substrate-binding protein
MVAAGASLTLAACGGTSNGSSAASASGSSASQSSSGGGSVVSGPGGTVTIRSIDDLDTFDPAKTGAPNMASQALELTYDRLTYVTPNGQLKPYLASSWTTTPNSATFKIRRGAVCDDGSPVTPAVVANSLRYQLSVGPYSSFATGPGKLKSVTYSDSADTVTVTLTKPYNSIALAMSDGSPSAIICPKGLANKKSLSTAPDGSGPYLYDASRSVRGSTYVFTLRKNYSWGPLGWTANKPGVPTTIIDRVITDETTAANAFLTGQVNIAPVFGINEPRVAANSSAYNFSTSSLQMGSWGTVFNQSPGRVGTDPAVRHAAFLALDGPSMVKAAFSNLGVPFATEVTPNMGCYNPAVGKATAGYNIALAKQVLEQDGYKPGSGGVMAKNGKPLQLKITTWNVTNQLGDYMQQALSKVGISSTVENTDYNTWVAALFTTKNYDLTVFSYYSSLPNPFIIPAQDATLSVNDPTYFALSEKAEGTPGAAQCPEWDKALIRGESNYDVKPIGVSKNMWFAKGWKFAAPFFVIVDPFTLVQTK